MSELERILEEVKEADEVSKTTRTQFWKLVRQIKRERNPNKAEIKIATKIRNNLFLRLVPCRRNGFRHSLCNDVRDCITHSCFLVQYSLMEPF